MKKFLQQISSNFLYLYRTHASDKLNKREIKPMDRDAAFHVEDLNALSKED